MNYDGPTTCTGDGNYQHHSYSCVNGVPQFGVASWQNADGTTTVVPPELRAPDCSPGTVEGTTIVKNGTLWEFHLDQGGYVDTGVAATPLVVFNTDGSVKSAGYNPGTGEWINLDGSTGPAPVNAKKIPIAFDKANAALSALGSLLGK